MNLGIIDVVEWQTAIDMRSGTKVDVDGPLAVITRKILSAHPYPGDLEPESIDWVTRVARNLHKNYRPRLMVLSYAQPFFLSVFRDTSSEERKEMVKQILKNIGYFSKETGMVPFILGTGGLVPVDGYIDLSHLDGLALGGGMAGRHIGLHEPTTRDMDYVGGSKLIKEIFSRDELVAHFGGDEDFIKRLPDCLLVAREGYAFKSFGSMTRPCYMLPADSEEIPVYSPLGKVDHIAGIRRFIEEALTAHSIVLVIIEGAGFKEFPEPYSTCNNTLGWYRYTPGDGQYLTITTGKHLSYHTYLSGFKHYVYDTEDREYPFSGMFFGRYNIDTLGSDFAGRSAAVGTRSILTHVSSGADITIECFARGLYNYGTIGVINSLHA